MLNRDASTFSSYPLLKKGPNSISVGFQFILLIEEVSEVLKLTFHVKLLGVGLQ